MGEADYPETKSFIREMSGNMGMISRRHACIMIGGLNPAGWGGENYGKARKK
jgi:hypothetical protein